MSVYKKPGSKIYWYSFHWRGERVQESTKQSNKTVARQIEAARKTQLAKGEVGIKDRERVPTLKHFAETVFIPHVESRKQDKPATVAFYSQRCSCLIDGMGKLRLDQIGEKNLNGLHRSQTEGQS